MLVTDVVLINHRLKTPLHHVHPSDRSFYTKSNQKNMGEFTHTLCCFVKPWW